MKILIDSYNEINQNKEGGMQTKIASYIEHSRGKYEVKQFDKWNDRLEDYDILHIFMANPQELSLLKLAKSRGLKTVVSSVIPYGNRFRILASRAICKVFSIHSNWIMVQDILQNADVVIAETIYEKNFINKYYGINSDKIVVIPNGININLSSYVPGYFRKNTQIKGKFILQVGRFDSNKNQLNTIRAVKGANLQLVLIGGADKSDPLYLEKCKQEAGDNVHFLGWVDHDDPLLLAAYMECQTVVLPSYKEILGNAMIEGAACGANVVVTDVLPLDDWNIKDCCYAIKAGSVKDIRQKLLLADKKEHDDILKNKVKNLFSWDKVIERHEEIYSSLLKGKA